MAELWVVVDHDDGDVRKVTLQALAGGRRVAADLGLDVAAVFIGSGFDRSRDRLAGAGAGTAYVAQSDALDGDRLVATMSVFGGATVTRCLVRGAPQIVCVKPNAFVAEDAPGDLAEV